MIRTQFLVRTSVPFSLLLEISALNPPGYCYTTKRLHPASLSHDPKQSVITPPIPPDIAEQQDVSKKVTILATNALA